MTQHPWLSGASALAMVAAHCAAASQPLPPKPATSLSAQAGGGIGVSNALAIAAMRADMDAQFAAILAALKVAPPPPPPPACPAGGPLAAVTIGPTQLFTEMAYAMPCMAPGFTMTVQSGTADLVPFDIPPGLDGWTILGQADGKESVDGRGGLAGGHRLAWGKGCIHAQSPGRVYGIVLQNCGGPAAGGGGSGEAGLYAENFAAPGTLVADHVMFQGNDDGIFIPNTPGPGANVSLDVESSDFVNNGQSKDGLSHDIYDQGAALIVNNSNFYGNPYGNQIKTRAPTNKVTGGYNANVAGGRWIDAASGGSVSVQGGVYDVPANSPGENVVGYGEEFTSNGLSGFGWTGAKIYIGRYSSTLEVATGGTVTFDGTNALTWTGSGASIGVANGGSVAGLPSVPPAGTVFGSDPTPPPHISGAP